MISPKINPETDSVIIMRLNDLCAADEQMNEAAQKLGKNGFDCYQAFNTELQTYVFVSRERRKLNEVFSDDEHSHLLDLGIYLSDADQGDLEDLGAHVQAA